MSNHPCLKWTGLLIIVAFLAGTSDGSARQGSQTSSPPAGQAKPAASPPSPRGRSITLGDVSGFEAKDNIFPHVDYRIYAT